MSITRSTKGREGITYESLTLNPHSFQVVLDVARQNELKTVKLFGKQLQLVASIKIAGDLLPKIREVTYRTSLINEAGNGLGPVWFR